MEENLEGSFFNQQSDKFSLSLNVTANGEADFDKYTVTR